MQETIDHVKNEITNCAESISQAGGIPCFCTISAVDLHAYNNSLVEKRKTAHLHHTAFYQDMMKNIILVLDEVNSFISSTNEQYGMHTPYCHFTVKVRRGKKKAYYKYMYNRLKDGVHGTAQTIESWAKAISAAIKNNRLIDSLPLSSDSDMMSPKRAWKTERDPKRARLE